MSVSTPSPHRENSGAKDGSNIGINYQTRATKLLESVRTEFPNDLSILVDTPFRLHNYENPSVDDIENEVKLYSEGSGYLPEFELGALLQRFMKQGGDISGFKSRILERIQRDIKFDFAVSIKGISRNPGDYAAHLRENEAALIQMSYNPLLGVQNREAGETSVDKVVQKYQIREAKDMLGKLTLLQLLSIGENEQRTLALAVDNLSKFSV